MRVRVGRAHARLVAEKHDVGVDEVAIDHQAVEPNIGAATADGRAELHDDLVGEVDHWRRADDTQRAPELGVLGLRQRGANDPDRSLAGSVEQEAPAFARLWLSARRRD